MTLCRGLGGVTRLSWASMQPTADCFRFMLPLLDIDPKSMAASIDREECWLK